MQNLWNSLYSNCNKPTEEELKHMKSIKMLAAQRQHIKKLQDNLEKDENIFFRVFMSIPGWEMFITKHTSTYQRPKDVIPRLKSYFKNLEIVFDTEDTMPSKVQFIVTYSNGNGYKSYQHCKFRTNDIPIADIENFLQNNKEI